MFLRRVRSRILYEQMIGRATRLCPEIGKERFRIFDAVDLYSALKDVTDMKPVVVNPLVTFEQLAKEVVEGEGRGVPARRRSRSSSRSCSGRSARSQGEAEERVRDGGGHGREGAGRTFLKKSGVGDAADYLTSHPALARVPRPRRRERRRTRWSSPSTPTSCARSRAATASTGAAARATTSRLPGVRRRAT